MRPEDREAGSSVVEFSLVTLLVLFLFLLVAQVGVALHARNVLVAAAAEGARHAANADRTEADGAARALAVVADALPGVAGRTSATATTAGDPRVVDVALTSELPVVFSALLPLRVTVHGHALEESP